MTERSGYVLETLQASRELTLYWSAERQPSVKNAEEG
jgi:hypothetical protein